MFDSSYREIAQRLARVRTLALAFSIGLIPCWLPIASVSATTYTWTNTGSNGNWGDIFKWAGFSAPPTGGVNTDIILQGTDTSPDIQNIANVNVNYDIDSITLSSAYAANGTMFLTGGELTVDNQIVNDDSQELEFNSVVHLGDQFLSLRANSGDLDFDSAIEVTLFNSTISASGGENVFLDGGISRSIPAITDATLNISDGTFVRVGGSLNSPLKQVNVSGASTLQISSTLSLPNAVNIDVAAGSTFRLNNINENIDRLTGGGYVDLGVATLTVGDSSSFIYSGTLSGTGGIVHDGPSTMTLIGLQSYTGPTAITGGTLRLSGSNRLSNSTDVNVSSGATFDLNGSSETVESISGAGTIRLGGGTLTVDENSGTQTFSGDILEAGKLAKNGGGKLVLSGEIDSALLDINAGIVEVSGLADLATIELGNATLQVTNSLSTSELSFTPIRLNGSTSQATINIDSPSTIRLGSPIIGTGGFTKQGDGNLTLEGKNSYIGSTKIFDGRLNLTGPNSLPKSTDVEMISGALLNVGSTYATVHSLSGTGGVVRTISSGGLLFNAASGTFFWGGQFQGAGGFTKAGDHTLVVTGFQVHTGVTFIDGGVLQFSANGNFDSDTDVSISSGATWDLNGLSDSVESINGTGSIKLGGATLAVSGIGGPTRTFSGVISEAGNFRMFGIYTLNLTGNNTYTGRTELDSGVLRVNSSNNLGGGELEFGGGTLNTISTFTNSRAVLFGGSHSKARFDVDTSTTLTQSGQITGAATTTLIKKGGGTLRTTASNGGTFFGDIEIEDGTFDLAGGGDGLSNLTTVTVNSPGIFLVNNPDDIGALDGDGSVVLNQILRIGHNDASTTFSGVLSGVGLFGKRGAGTVTLTGNNTYTGLTDIDGETLRLSGAGRISNSSNVDIALGTTFDLNDVTDTIGALSGSGSVLLGGGGVNAFTIGANNSSGTFGGVISGMGDLVKSGTGTQTLTGANTYLGATVVDLGTLTLADGGSISQTSLTINSGGTATLDGAATTWDLSGNLLIGSGGDGHLNIDQGATLTVNGSVTLGSTGIAGTLSLDGGTLDNSAGSVIAINTGTLQGQGTLIGNVFNEDFVAPGNSAGILTVTGNFDQNLTGMLSIEIGGTDNSDLFNPEFDLLDISGMADIDGQLELTLINGFTPNATDTFSILSSSTLAGMFSNVANGARLDLSAGGTGSFQVDYTGTSVILSNFSATTFTADFDQDGGVDGDDLTDLVNGWQARYGVDLDGSNFLDWQRQFGSGVPLLASSQTVPEPSTAALLLLGFIGLLESRHLGVRFFFRGALPIVTRH